MVVTCAQCGKPILRSPGRITEGNKFSWKIYCSRKCESLCKNKKILIICSNPGCRKTFTQYPKYLYCSRSCAVTVNNSKYPPKHRPIIRTCQICNKKFVGETKYCSKQCASQAVTISNEEIIKSIQKFYQENGRIPFKQEFLHSKSARLRFGTWNNAVITAGFKPNPVRFADKFIANDGHKCDSLAEKIIDDWLSLHNIAHLKSPRYPNSKFTSDFKVGDTYIEFFGLANGLFKYDNLKEEKLKMITENNYKLISIYPRDIFPASNLNLVLADLPGDQVTS